MNHVITRQEKFYICACVAFSGLLILSNMVYQKFVTLSLGGYHFVDISAGALTYPLTFLITDVITELYGASKAKFCIRVAIGLNIVVALVMVLLDFLPATGWSKVSQEVFHTTFGHYGFAIAASLLASYVAQLVDISLYASLKASLSGRFLVGRAFLSTALALVVDSFVVVGCLTLWGILPQDQFFTILTGSWKFKFVFTALNSPIFFGVIKIARWLVFPPPVQSKNLISVAPDVSGGVDTDSKTLPQI